MRWRLALALLDIATAAGASQRRGAASSEAEPAAADTTMDGGLASVLERSTGAFAERLLHPYSLGGFHAELWERTPHHFRRSASLPHHNADLVPVQPPAALQAFVGGCVSAQKATRGRALQALSDVTLVKKGGMPMTADHPNISPVVMEETLGNGYSIVMNWMQYRSSPTAQLAQAFEASLGHDTNINLYHTPARSEGADAEPAQAFNLHYDETDVFVLQLAGTKVWALHSLAVPFARSDEARLANDALTAMVAKVEPQEVVMAPGDMLYIPRGVPHTARNLQSDAASSHLTIGTQVYLWQTIEGWMHRAVIHWLVKQQPADEKLQALTTQLDQWVPATALAAYLVNQKKLGDEAARAIMRASRTQQAGSSGTAAALLHAAVRVAANANPALRRAATFANAPLRSDWNAAVSTLCGGKKLIRMSEIVEAVRGWESRNAKEGQKAADDTADGLGSLAEFTAALKASHLAVQPAVPKNGGSTAGQSEAEWLRALPFSGAVDDNGGTDAADGNEDEAPETQSETHARGTKGGLSWLTQGQAGPGSPPKGAWKKVRQSKTIRVDLPPTCFPLDVLISADGWMHAAGLGLVLCKSARARRQRGAGVGRAMAGAGCMAR